MAERTPAEQQADTINEQMVRQMEVRRQEQPERRKRTPSVSRGVKERRRLCTFCYQPGDHATAAQCLRSLER
jgi:hypothetical protein